MHIEDAFTTWLTVETSSYNNTPLKRKIAMQMFARSYPCFFTHFPQFWIKEIHPHNFGKTDSVM